MLLSAKYLIIFTTFLAGVIVHSLYQSPEGRVVSECKDQSMMFEVTEKQYVDYRGLVFPSLQGPQKKDLLLKAYKKELTQRPFECISNRLENTSKSTIEMTPEYKNLIQMCKYEEPRIVCDPSSPYRTFDGTCNNLRNPKWGSVQTCARRLLPASYEGVSGFRKSVCGKPLPEPRTLSLTLMTDADRPDPINNNMFLYFGQVLSHDITDIPASYVGDELIDCCSNPNFVHPQCAPILLPPDDPVYSKLNITCFNFVRTAPCASCTLGKRNQMIQATSYLDGSVIYGLSKEEASSLRRKDGTGKMRTQHTEAGELLPRDYELGSSCGSLKKNEYCFLAGDRRVNMHAPLSSFHTILVREHNRLAGKLKALNPHWNDEKLYQEARKLVGAILQVIAYNEFLPLILRPDVMSSHNLWIGKECNRSVYNPQVDSTMLMEFSSGAFRLHTIVGGKVTDFGVDGGKKTLTDFTRDASTIYHGQMEMMLQGMCFTASQKFDRHMTKEITQNLYKGRERYGLDLASIDLQRGRDTGTPPYTELVRFLTGGKIDIRTFDDLEKVFEHKNVELMKTVYSDPRDIDFDVGIYYENSKESTMWSKTADEIIARQFSDLKAGDRFYFEHSGNFNHDQLQTLRDVTLSSILCANSKISNIPKHSMTFPSRSNPAKPCSKIPKLNLDYWKDNLD